MDAQISDKFKCIFAHVPKSAGSSIEASKLFDDRRKSTGRAIGGHTTVLEYQKYFPKEFEEYFKFAFVRNPWDRLVSAFFYLNQRRDKEHEKIKSIYLDKYQGNFHRFCQEFVNKENIEKVFHFKPQISFLCNERGCVLVDYIGRFENLEADFFTICKKVNCVPFKLRRKNASRRMRNFYCYYTPEIYKIVEAAYSDDIETFGY